MFLFKMWFGAEGGSVLSIFWMKFRSKERKTEEEVCLSEKRTQIHVKIAANLEKK